jgi:glycerol kinase
MSHILALDQGTTSSRAILFDRRGRPVAMAQREFPQIYPKPGDVEHDPEAIWDSQLATAKEAVAASVVGWPEVSAIGITNQRETTVVWDRATGKPVANAIVWQSRVTTPICDRLKKDGLEPTFRQMTGLVVDPYFSGTKLKHLLDTIPGLRGRAEKGEVLFGTIDTFLAWRLTGGKVHATDVGNASRTLMFDIRTLDWDDELLKILGVPRAMLPKVVPTSGVIGETDESVLGAKVPIAALAGDQQAATFGQGCFTPGSAKNTYGTGCFMLMNTDDAPVPSQHGLLTTVGWQVNGKTTYCLEGSILIAGAVVQWLRDSLKIIAKSVDVEALAATVSDTGGVYFVPAFAGLGAPYWNPGGRGTIVGMTRATTAAHVARAALEAIAFRTRDVLDAMRADAAASGSPGAELAELKVDGGACANDLLMQFQADVLGVTVRRPVVRETTALGAAALAGLAVGLWPDLNETARVWTLDRNFFPQMPRDEADRRYARWQKAVERAFDWETGA